jgi:hypothetical protein
MLVVPDYRGHRIEATAMPAGDRFNPEVRIRRTLTDEKPIVETVTCFKVSAALAEAAAELWAKRWIDLQP